MKPVSVSIDVPQPIEAVYAHLDVMANHEPFTDHMLQDWRYEGPPSGIGSRARVTSVAGPVKDEIEIEVISANAPTQIVERNVGAKGKRVGTGTYDLAPLPDGGTKINFTYAWEKAPFAERLFAPAARSVLRKGNQKAMERLAEQLPSSGE
jgi:carbon monoxide dehydrogenase subunit G